MKHFSAKNLLAACVVSTVPIVLATDAVTAAPSSNCTIADPSGVLASVGGDFEIAVDPQDPAGNAIFVANLASGASSVVAARINGVSGQVVNQTLTPIANNFLGQTKIQGPEFVQRPTGELGVLYAGPGGVHAVFRSRIPAAWNDLVYDVTGAPTGGSPPVLPASSDGAYPKGPLPLGQNTYGQWRGTCQGICYGSFGSNVTTDVVAVLTPQGFTAASGAQSPRDGYVFLGLCDANDACGIYEAQIDNAGGFTEGSFQLLAEVNDAPAQLAAARHPVTGATVLFSDGGSRTIDVWQQPAGGGPLSLVAHVSANKHEHFRAETSATQVVLHYLSAALLADGSFTIPVSANGTSLVAGASKKISSYGHGAEFLWLPAANKWALLYRGSGNVPTRCWVTP